MPARSISACSCGRHSGAARREGCKDAGSAPARSKSTSECSWRTSGRSPRGSGLPRDGCRAYCALIQRSRSHAELRDFHHGLLGFDWTRQQPERVQGIAYMEALVQPITWADFPEDVRSLVQGCRSKDGETLVLEKNLIVENVLPGAILRRLSEDEMAAYRAPFANAGEDRRPTLAWLRQIPIEGETPEVVRVATDCGRWLADSRIP